MLVLLHTLLFATAAEDYYVVLGGQMLLGFYGHRLSRITCC